MLQLTETLPNLSEFKLSFNPDHASVEMMSLIFKLLADKPSLKNA